MELLGAVPHPLLPQAGIPAPSLTRTTARAYPYRCPCPATPLFGWVDLSLYINRLGEMPRLGSGRLQDLFSESAENMCPVLLMFAHICLYLYFGISKVWKSA